MTDLSREIEDASKTIVQSIAKESAAVRDLREFNTKASAADPAKVGWPASLTIELALRTASPQELKSHYGFDDDEWAALRLNPVFVAELAEMCDLVKQEGMSFKLKIRLQAEGMLDLNWKLAHAPASEVPAAVKARIMESTFRMAGYDSKDVAGVGAGGNSLAIQINLGDASPSIEHKP